MGCYCKTIFLIAFYKTVEWGSYLTNQCDSSLSKELRGLSKTCLKRKPVHESMNKFSALNYGKLVLPTAASVSGKARKNRQ